MWSRRYIHNSSYYHHQIRSISFSHCCYIFPWWCAWGGCTIICSRFHICIWETWVLCLLLLCSLMMCTNSRVHYDSMAVFVCLHITLPHYHHYVDLSSGIELLKCLLGTFCLVCVSKITSILSDIFHAIYGAMRIQLTHFSYGDCENTCTLSYFHHQIVSVTHLLLFRVRSWNNGMRCTSFDILIKIFSVCSIKIQNNRSCYIII